MRHLDINSFSFNFRTNFILALSLLLFANYQAFAEGKIDSIQESITSSQENLYFSQLKPKGSKHFHKGFYFGAQAAGGLAYNERAFTPYANWFYGLDMAAGYRFYPQLSFGLGFGGYSYFTRTSRGYSAEYLQQTTSIPVFIRLRSDLLNKKFSPFVQLELGYSFIILNSQDADDKIKYNNDVFMDRVHAKGYETLEEYKTAFEKSLRDIHNDGIISLADLDALISQKWEAELISLKKFSNGRQDYIAGDNTHLQYGKRGLFTSLDLGLGYKVGDRARFNIALSIGLSQSYFGTCLRTMDNKLLNYSRVDYLPSEPEQEPIMVRTFGTENFRNSFDLDFSLKLGISF